MPTRVITAIGGLVADEPVRMLPCMTIGMITILTDATEYTKEEIADPYGFRWQSELDIRSIEESLNLGHVRCKSPEMIRREVWTTLLDFNRV